MFLFLFCLKIDYPPFEKNFFIEHEELSSLTEAGEVELRQKLNLKVRGSTCKHIHKWSFSFFPPTLTHIQNEQVSGAAPPKPATSFAHFGFDEQLMHQIRKSEYTQPTPIQCQVSCQTLPQMNHCLFGYWFIWFIGLMCVSLGCSDSFGWQRHNRHCQNWQWKDCSFHLANAGAHHGPEGAGAGRGTHCCNRLPHQRALSTGQREKQNYTFILGKGVKVGRR